MFVIPSFAEIDQETLSVQAARFHRLALVLVCTDHSFGVGTDFENSFAMFISDRI